MPNKRHARRTHRDAARLASAGDPRTALTGFNRAATDYRDHLAAHPDDRHARTELADLLGQLADAHLALSRPAEAAGDLTERLGHLRELGTDRSRSAQVELDLAEAHLHAGHLLTAATSADNALRTFDHRDAADPAAGPFTDLAAALARNARILRSASDPDLAVGAADQAARMLLATDRISEDPERMAHLRSALTVAVELHTAAGRTAHAQSAAHLLTGHFLGAEPPVAGQHRPLTLRASLVAAARLGMFADANLIDRLCPDPASHEAPPAISARCDPGLAPVALHAVAPAVEALRVSHPPLAWRLATEIHYLLVAADQQGERNLRLNFRDHAPVWLTMLLCLTETAAADRALASDLARVLADSLGRLRSRHGADGRGPVAAAATRFIDRFGPR